MMYATKLFFLILIISNYSCAQTNNSEFPQLSGPYLGQTPPGKTAVPFAENIIAKEYNLHGSLVFTPDGNEAYWSIMSGGMKIMFSKKINGVWTKPALFLSDSDVPFISPDGDKFLYIAQKKENGIKKEEIQVMHKTITGWSDARPLHEINNSIPVIHWQLSVDQKGCIYFGGKQGNNQKSQIFTTELDGDKYLSPRVVKDLQDSDSFSPYIAPDGSYLIATLFKEDLGLFILFKKADETWTKAINISEYIGLSGEMLCPIVTHDGKYLFFLRGVGERTIPFWVDASFIEELRKKELDNI